MQTFYLTFASKTPFRNGWVEIEAENREKAVDLIEKSFGGFITTPFYKSSFSFFGELYEEFDSSMFPLGKIGDTIK